MFIARISVLLLLASSLLAGCGFQLRGQAELPPGLSRIFIQSSQGERGTDSLLVQTLGSSLVANGVTLATSATEADAVLRVLDEDLDRRTIASNPNGSTREYTLNYSVSYSLVDSNKQTLVEPNRLTLTRDVIYSEADVLGRSQGEDIVLKDMIHDAAYSIIRRLEILARQG